MGIRGVPYKKMYFKISTKLGILRLAFLFFPLGARPKQEGELIEESEGSELSKFSLEVLFLKVR